MRSPSPKSTQQTAARRPRVVVLSQIPTPYRLPLFRLLAERPEFDFEVLFCAAAEPGRPWQVDEELTRVPHRVLPAFRLREDDENALAFSINPTVIGAIRAARPDVLVVGGYAIFAEQAALLYALVTRLPYVVHSESHLLKNRPTWLQSAKRALLPLVLGRAAAALATGSAAADYLAAHGVDRGRIRIMPNTIDVARYGRDAATASARGDAIRRERGLPDEFILYVGRLLELKGVTDLLEARHLLGPDAPELVVAGTGPLAAEVAAAPGVTHLGFQSAESLIELFSLAKLTVVPSRGEPWGVVVNEALACGSPVVVSDAVGAARDLVVDGVNGRIFPAGDALALAAALAAPRPPGDPAQGRIERWTYDFGVEQFVEAIRLALPDGSRQTRR